MLNPLRTFQTLPFSPSNTVSWIHIGDTHLTRSGEQNEIDLGRIVDEINEVYAKGGIDFVFVPGDIADDGSIVAYSEFRKHLDRLKLPWCAIVGDHDVHEKSFSNFQRYAAEDLYGAFSIGPYRFLRLNAFSAPRPDSFEVDQEQLEWLEEELVGCEQTKLKAVVFLHCYPSDLKQGGGELTALLRRYPVLLVDMGHTHYNEISNDGKILYSATRSTGQIEEGPVGYSVITLDGDCVDWNFVELGKPSLVAITMPMDERLTNAQKKPIDRREILSVHAKVWSSSPIEGVFAQVGNTRAYLYTEDGILWKGEIDTSMQTENQQELTVVARDQTKAEFRNSIRLSSRTRDGRKHAERDQDNSVGEWKERGLLGTQLGPNKNGRKW